MNSLETLQNGTIILIDKPIEFSSFSIVKQIRYNICKLHKIKNIKIGHAGTLDPKATGLLVLATGRYTKKINFLQNGIKTYIGKLKLGAQTPSYDTETQEIFIKSINNISISKIINQTKNFIGEINQIPPMYSAIKYKGKRLFSLARQGIKIKISSRKIQIYDFQISKINLPFVNFKVICSKGTYIRSLIKDFGDSLGCGAYLIELRRIKSGIFNINQALNFKNIIIDNKYLNHL